MEETRTRGPLRRVLLATDRSAASRAALLAVAGLAVGAGIEVVVLHVDEDGRPEDARTLVDDVAWGLIALAVDARPEVRRAACGRVAAEIAAAAAAHEADLVVLGSRGRSDLGGLLPGRVGREVVERVPGPVLLVRDGRRASARRPRVLVAITGAERLPELARTAAAVAGREAQVLVLHLLAPEEGGPELVARMVADLRRRGVRARGPARAAGAALAFAADLVLFLAEPAPTPTLPHSDGERQTR